MATNIGNNKLKAWLRFDKSPVDDVKGNNWTTYGNPTIGTANAINGNALQLDGQSYIKLSGIELGGQDFYIDGWVYVDSASPDYARIISVVNPSNGYYLFSFRKSSTDSTKLDVWLNSYADVIRDFGYTYTESTSSVGQRVHFKLIYRYTASNYTDRRFYLCINDRIVAKTESNFIQYNRQTFDIYIGADSNGTQGLIGSIDELRIYDGTWFSYNNGTPPTAADYTNIYFNCDLKCNVTNPPITWRYENAGTADLLTISGTTVTGLDSSQSKTGTAFYQSTRAKCFDIPNTKEIWIKCDIFTTANYADGDRIRIYSEDSNGVNGWCTQTPISTKYQIWHNNTSVSGVNYFAKNKMRSIVLHMVSDATDGIIEYFFASGITQNFTGNVNNGDDFNNVYIQMDGSNILVSNLIISNAPIDIDEDVATITVNFDTARGVTTQLTLYADIARNVIKPLYFDTCRYVSNFVALDFDLTRIIAGTISVNLAVDTVRNVANSLIVIQSIWRYENYGTASLLKISGNTVTDLPASKSKTGSAFWQNQRVATFPIPATKELWVKFDLYYGDAQWRAYDRLNGNDTGVGRYQQANTITSFINGPLQYQLNPQNTLTNNQLKTYLLHMVSDAENGLVELWVDGVKYYSDDFAGEGLIYKGNVEGGADFDNFYLQSASSANLFSNVIISNTRIGLGENVIGQGLSSYLDFDIVRVVEKDFFDLIINADLARVLVNHLIFPLSINVDTVRDVKRDFWRYENYGSSALLVNDIQTTFEVPIEFSRTGFGYVPLETTDLVQFDVPAADDIWIKFDCFVDDLPNIYGENRQIKLGIGSRADKHFQKTGVEICFSVTDTTITAVDVLPISDNIFTTSAIKFLKIHRVMLHLMPYSMEVFIDNNVCLAAFSQSRTNFANFYIHWLSPPQVLPLISNVIISDKALNIFEDVSYISYPKNLVLDCGLYRDVHLGFWRYENFGTDELLIFPTQTFSDLPASKSKTGSAFIQNNYANCFSFPPTNEVWLQFDVYLPLSSTLSVGIRKPEYEGTGPTGSTGFRGRVAFITNYKNYVSASGLNKVVPFSGKYEYYQAKGYMYLNSDKGVPTETLSTCLLHMMIGDDVNILDGLIEFWVDGEKVFAVSGNVNDGLAIDKLALITEEEDDNHGLFSSIIISNAHPDFKLIRADLCRVLYSSNLFVLLADTARTLPHKIFSSPIEHSGDTPDIHNTSAGLQNFEIRLGEQQLTDFVNFTVTKPINIMEQVKGQYLDYLFDMRVESLKQRGILRTCNCCSDIDNLLYKQIEYSVPPNEQWHNPDDPFWQQHHQNVEDDIPKALASQHVNHIATVLGKQPVIRFADFVSTVDISAGGSTYADLIRNIFGWSSRIPHKMINCFLRDTNLYVIQRGFEDNLIDLSNAVTDIVSFDRELVRTTWGSSLWAKTEIRSKFLGWREVYNRDDYKVKKSSLGDANYSYDNDGLISHTSIYNDDGSTTYIDYQYKTLASGRKILVSESHSVFKDGVQIDYQQIIHTPLEQGQSHAMAIGQDGDYLGSNVGQSTGDDRVTPYEKFSRVLESVYADEQRTINGITLFDTSFPVYGDDKLAEITAAIRWLNRKTQETAILNLYDFPHVVDFNDRILLNGNEYYLKSNTTLQNTRIVNKQTLSLVRWF